MIIHIARCASATNDLLWALLELFPKEGLTCFPPLVIVVLQVHPSLWGPNGTRSATTAAAVPFLDIGETCQSSSSRISTHMRRSSNGIRLSDFDIKARCECFGSRKFGQSIAIISPNSQIRPPLL